MPTGQTPRPKVSVAIVTYNHERFIEKTLNGILDQKRDFDIEIVIGEDSSTDGTAPSLKGMFKIIEKFVSCRRMAISARRNAFRVLGACRKENIAALDGRRLLGRPGKIDDQVRLMDGDPTYRVSRSLNILTILQLVACQFRSAG